ncbi:MAG: hypothetical protein IT318_02640, partial [Anaerolineales bacterium]|nr:hypothetical protein [Anaerolineales bacterium]
YYAGGQRIAERVGDSTLYFLLDDHLGSTSITANSRGALVAEVRYLPWGGRGQVDNQISAAPRP